MSDLNHDELIAAVVALWGVPVHERRMAAVELLELNANLLERSVNAAGLPFPGAFAEPFLPPAGSTYVPCAGSTRPRVVAQHAGRASRSSSYAS